MSRSFIACRLALVVFVGIGLVSVGCATDRSVIAQAQDVHKGLEPAVLNDQQLTDYIQRVGQRIVDVAQQMDQEGFGPASHRKGEDSSWMFQQMEFHFVNSKTLNAFTTGGKHMYIYNELFQTVKNEDELAAVMAHEYAHVYCRHVAKGMNRQYTMLGIAAGAGAAGAAAGYASSDHNNQQALTYGGVAAGAALMAGQYLGMGFTRDDENEADKIGFQFYCRAGWDPQKFAGFFQTLIDKGLDKTPEALSDHPKLSTRVENTKRRISELPPDASKWRRPPVASESQFHQLQARAAQLGKTMPNDQSLQKAQLMLAAFPSCVSPEEQPDQKEARSIIYQAQQELRKNKR